MGRKPKGDRCYHRWNKQKRCWEIVAWRGRERTITRCPSGASEEEAAGAARIIDGDLKAARIDLPHSWDEAVEGYLAFREDHGDAETSRVTAGYRLRNVGRTLGDVDPLRLTVDQGRYHRDERLAEGRSPKTVNAELAEVAMLQRWMVRQGWIPTATWSDVPRSKKRVPPRAHLRPGEVGPWLEVALQAGESDPLWPAAAVLLLHGLRTGELRRLRVGDLDLRCPVTVAGRPREIVVAYVEESKSDAGIRPVPIVSEVACRVLRATFQAVPRVTPCFWSRREPGVMLAPRTEWFRRRVQRTCEAAGVRAISTHGLRHSTGTLLVSLPGVSYYDAGKVLGHHDPSVTDRVYAHAALAPRLDAMGTLGAFLDQVAISVTVSVTEDATAPETREADPGGSASHRCERGDSNPHRHTAH